MSVPDELKLSFDFDDEPEFESSITILNEKEFEDGDSENVSLEVNSANRRDPDELKLSFDFDEDPEFESSIAILNEKEFEVGDVSDLSNPVKTGSAPAASSAEPGRGPTVAGVQTGSAPAATSVKPGLGPTATALPSNADSFKTFDANAENIMGPNGDRCASRGGELKQRTSNGPASNNKQTTPGNHSSAFHSSPGFSFKTFNPAVGPRGDDFVPINTSTPIITRITQRRDMNEEEEVATLKDRRDWREIDSLLIKEGYHSQSSVSYTPVNVASNLATMDAAPVTGEESGNGISAVPSQKTGLIIDKEGGGTRGSVIIHGLECANPRSSYGHAVPVAKKGQAAIRCTAPFISTVEESEVNVEDPGSDVGGKLSDIRVAVENSSREMGPPNTDSLKLMADEAPGLTEDEASDATEDEALVEKTAPIKKKLSRKRPSKVNVEDLGSDDSGKVPVENFRQDVGAPNTDRSKLLEKAPELMTEKSQRQKSSSSKVKIENARGLRRILPGGIIIIPEKKGSGAEKTDDQAEQNNKPVETIPVVCSDTPIVDLGDLDGYFDFEIPDEGSFRIPGSIWNMDFESALSGQELNLDENVEDKVQFSEQNVDIQILDETEATENFISNGTATEDQILYLKEWLTDCKENIFDMDVVDADSAGEEIDRIKEDWQMFKMKRKEIEELQSGGVSLQYQKDVKELMDCCKKIDESFEISVKALQLMEENFRTLGIRIEENVDGDTNFTPRFFTDAEIKAISADSDGAAVTQKKNQILGLFKAFLRAAGEEQEIQDIPFKELSRALGSFWYTLTKKDGKHHDVGSLKTMYSRLNVVIKGLLGGIDPLKHEDFEIYRTLRKAKLRKSKEQPGNGQMRHRADMLHPEEVRYLFFVGVINPATPWGILRTIYVYLVGICNNRAVMDNNRLTLGNINIMYDSLGRVEYADVRLQKQKRDQGDREQPVKRPRIVPLEDKRRCFFSAWFPYMEYRAMLGTQFLEEESFVFLQPRITADYVASGNRCLFKPEYLKVAQMKHLVKNMCIEGRLSLQGRKICNTSLRLMAFKNQGDTGITESQAQALDGHLSIKTRREYDRGNEDNMDAFGAALACAATGSKAILPRPAGVKLTDHLHGPLTVKSGPTIDMSRSVLSVRRKDDQERIVTPGNEASRVLPAFAVAFDGQEPAKDVELSIAYTQHRNEKYDDLFGGRATYGDEDDFNEMFGGVSVEEEVPQLPKLGEPNGVRPIPRQEYCTDGEKFGLSSKVWREPNILKEIRNQATKRAVSPGSMENQPPKKKVSPPKPKKKETLLDVGDIVFARTTIAPTSWPGQVEAVFHFITGEVSGYRVQLFGLKQSEDVLPKKVDRFNTSTYQKYNNPSMNKKKKIFEQTFPGALAEAVEKSGLGDLVNNKENAGDGKEN